MKYTILVVEDDPSIAEVIQIILEAEGYNVVTDHTGELVFQEKLSAIPHLALVDYLLPGTNGAEVIKKLKKSSQYGTIPIILMSANTETELMQIAQSNGVAHVIPKPFDVDQFITKIQSLLPH